MNSDFSSTCSEWKKSQKVKRRSRNGAGVLGPNLSEMLATTDRDSEEVSTRDNIRVLVRIRPKNDQEKKEKDSRTVVKILDPHTLMFDPKQEAVEFFFHGVKQKVYDYKTRPNKNLRFAFDQIFSPNQSNVEIFDNALKPLINHVICGFNCSVFAYGVTGSGKTYTMLGSAGNPGLSFLMAKELSNRIKEMANEYESEIVVSYLEVYNETIKDLLYPSGQLSIREDGLNGVNVPNLTLHKIQDTSDLLRMLSHGNKARTQHSTDHNAESSRSHAVFQIFVSLRKRITRLSLNYKMAKAKLVMVDLAGSERGSTTNSDCQRCKEGGSINKSLLALGNCINALADGKKHIPYRDSKLTRLLKDSLGGNCKTVMIATVGPTALSYDETYNTLKYSDRAKQIRVSLKKNVSIGPPDYQHYGKMIEDLQSEINQLKLVLQTERDTTNSLLEQQKTWRPPGMGYKTTPNISLPPIIHDPATLENFVQLLGQKKKLEEAHVEASINSRESEWRLMWQKWRIDSAMALHRGDNEGRQSSMLDLKGQYKNLRSEHERCQEKVGLAKRLVDFNDKEIDLIQKTFPDFSEQDDPFLTVTLREFLNYKTLEREVGTHKCIENFHQQMCSAMLDELLRTEIILSDNLKFSKYLHGMLEKHGIPIRARRHQALQSKIYGDKEPYSTKRRKDTFPWQESAKNMIEMIKSPIVEYETPDTAGDPHHLKQPLLNTSDNESVSNGIQRIGDSGDIFGRSQSSSPDSKSDSESYLPSGDPDYGMDDEIDAESENQEALLDESRIHTPSIEPQSSRVGTTYSIFPTDSLPRAQKNPSTDTCFDGSSRGLSGKRSKGTQEQGRVPPVSPVQSPFRSQQDKRHSDSSSSERKPHRDTERRKPISLLGRREQRSDYVTKANYSASFDEGEQQAQLPEKNLEEVEVTTFKDSNPIDVKLIRMSRTKSQASGIGLDKTKLDKCSSPREKEKKSPSHGDPLSFSRPGHGLKYDPLLHNRELTKNANELETSSRPRRERQTPKTFEPPLLQPSPAHRKARLSPPALSPNIKAQPENHTNLKNSSSRMSRIHSDSEISKESNRTVPSLLQRRPGPSPRTDFASTQMFARPSQVPAVLETKATKQDSVNFTLERRVSKEQQSPTVLPELTCSTQMSSIDKQKQKIDKGQTVNKLVSEGKPNYPKSRDQEEFMKKKTQETRNPCKQDSKEDFWTNGMFLPSPPESYASSEDGLTEADMSPGKFYFPEEGKKSMDEHHFKSRDHRLEGNIFQTPAPVRMKKQPTESPPRSSSWETVDDAEPSQISTRISKYKTTLPNMTPPERHHHSFRHPPDFFQDKLTSVNYLEDKEMTQWSHLGSNNSIHCGVGGKGDSRLDDNKFQIQFLEVQEGHGDHEVLIVKPPPGYEQPQETSYFTRLLSLPVDFRSF